MAELEQLTDARELAWLADRVSLEDLTPDERRRLEQLARELELLLPDDAAILDAEDLDDLKTELADVTIRATALDAVVTLVERNLDVVLDPGDEESGPIDVAKTVCDRLKAERDEGAKDATLPSRASTRTKAMRLLVDARLTVKRVDYEGELAGLIVAECRGDSGEVYKLGYDPRRNQWRCTCEAGRHRSTCSHLSALQLVTVRPSR